MVVPLSQGPAMFVSLPSNYSGTCRLGSAYERHDFVLKTRRDSRLLPLFILLCICDIYVSSVTRYSVLLLLSLEKDFDRTYCFICIFYISG